MHTKLLSSLICMLIVFLLTVVPALAVSEIERLNEKINQLEKELKDLKELIQYQQQSRDEEKERVKKLEEKMEKTSSSLGSAFKFKPYGMVKLDAAYDDSRTTAGNFVLYVPNESLHKDDNEFNMTARQTRVGLDIMAPPQYSWEAWG